MESQEYIEKWRQITDACGWPEDAKDMALRNAILLGLKNPMVQDTPTSAERIIEIATDIYNSDCQRSIMQTLSTTSAKVTAIQQGSTEVHKLQANQQEDGKTINGQNKQDTSKIKDQEGIWPEVWEKGILLEALQIQDKIKQIQANSGTWLASISRK